MTKLTTCNNIMCVYQEEDTCTKRKIFLNHNGQCASAMTIPVEETYINEKKQKFWEIVERTAD